MRSSRCETRWRDRGSPRQEQCPAILILAESELAGSEKAARPPATTRRRSEVRLMTHSFRFTTPLSRLAGLAEELGKPQTVL